MQAWDFQREEDRIGIRNAWIEGIKKAKKKKRLYGGLAEDQRGLDKKNRSINLTLVQHWMLHVNVKKDFQIFASSKGPPTSFSINQRRRA